MSGQIRITLKEERTGDTKIRDVDGGWFFDFNQNFIADKNIQREIIEEWIDERGKDQHNSELELIAWEMV